MNGMSPNPQTSYTIVRELHRAADEGAVYHARQVCSLSAVWSIY